MSKYSSNSGPRIPDLPQHDIPALSCAVKLARQIRSECITGEMNYSTG
jgi:hypothetical protein